MKCLRLAAFIAILIPGWLGAQDALETRVFEVMPEFLQGLQNEEMDSPTPRFSDPFASSVVPGVQAVSARAMLEKMGIPFLDGATAFFDSRHGRLQVRHRPVFLDLIQGLIESQNTPRFVSLTTHLIQAPGPLLREMAQPGPNQRDVTESLNRLLLDSAKAGSKVKVMNSSHLDLSPGEKARLEAVTEQRHVGDVKIDAQGTATLKMEQRAEGFRLELLPYIHADNRSLELNLAMELPAGPGGPGSLARQAMPPFSSATVKTTFNLGSGQSRLLNLWKPSSADESEAGDMLQALFVTAEIIQAKPILKPTTDGVKVDLLRPKERLSHVFSMPDARWREDPRFFQRAASDAGTLKLTKALAEVCEFTVLDSQHFEVKGDLETLEIFQEWVAESWNQVPKNVGVTLNILRGPGHALRPLLVKSQGQHDHASIFKTARELVAEGQARWSTTAYVPTKPGMKAISQSAREHRYLSDLELRDPQVANWKTASQPLGTVFEIDPVLIDNGPLIHLPCTLTWQTASITPRRESLTFGNAYELPRSDIHLARLETLGKYRDGQIRLIAAWQPRGDEALNRDDLLELAFVTVNVLKNRAQPTEEPPKTPPQPEKKDAQSMDTRTYRVAPDFLSFTVLPTEVEKPTKSSAERARDILQAQGIPFPAGSHLVYSRGSNRLWVTQTPDNHALIEAFIAPEGCGGEEKSLAFTLHLFQADGDLIRDLLAGEAQGSDRGPLKPLLEGVGAGTVMPVSTLRLITEGGQQAAVQQVQEHLHTTAGTIGTDDPSQARSEKRLVGTQLDLEPVLGPDSFTIDVNLSPEHHTSAPLQREETLLPAASGKSEKNLSWTDFQAETIQTALTLTSGTPRILAVWKPSGKPEFETQDILHIAILEAEVIYVKE